jgi:DNA excision repair protein ERCC-3
VNGIQLRYYQERALKNIFIEKKARSGIIILPCGAGKSLVAIEVIQRVKKNAVIFCESQVSAEQWRNELIKWTTIDSSKIVVFSAKWKKANPKKIEEASIFITTYSMVGMKRVV